MAGQGEKKSGQCQEYEKGVTKDEMLMCFLSDC